MAMDDFRSSSPSTVPGQSYPPPASSGVAHTTTASPRKSNAGRPLLLLVILIILLAAWWFMGDGGMRRAEPYVDVAPKGETVKSFPAALIPEGNPYIESSYSLSYRDSDIRFPVVEYASTKDYEATIDEFRRLLLADGWTVMKDGSVDETPITNFYAVKGEAQVNITVEEREIAPWVVIAYSEPE